MNRRFFMGGQLVTPQALSLFARMTTPATFQRQRQIDLLIRALLSAGVWDKLDALYVLAAETSQAALLNWKSPSYTATNAGATFTADRGFTGNGVSAYIATGYSPGDGQWTSTDHTFGRIVRDIGDSNSMDMGVNEVTTNFIGIQSSGSGWAAFDGYLSEILGEGSSPESNLCIVRAGSDFSAYRNGEFVDSRGGNLILPPYQFYLLAVNNEGTSQSHSEAQMSAAYFGAGLSAGEVAGLDDALADYMTAVGA